MLEFGLSTQEFRSRYLEQQPYVRKAVLTQPSMQWADFDALLHGLEPDESLVQLFNNGQVPPHVYLEDSFELGRHRRRINKSSFYGLLRQGATLVLNRIENHSVMAKRLCSEIGRFVGHQTTSNAYVSFSGNGTFGKHWDTHDVFAIQLIGKKRWQVFAPTLPLPLSHQTSERSQHTCPSVAALDCVLETGDLLYIPRGWWHQVTPFQQGSLHLSVGVYLPTVNDYLMWVCSRHLPALLDARRGVVDAASLAGLPEVLRTLSQAALAPQNLEDFRQDLATHERLSSEFDMALFLDNAATELRNDVRLMLTSCHRPDRERAELAVNGGRLKLEPVSRAIVSLFGDVMTLTLAELFARLPHYPQPVIRAAVLDLARYEVLTIHR